MYKVAIIHPWMPQYREKFLELLRSNLHKDGIELSVFYGETPREWNDRNDAVEPKWMTKLPTRFFRIKSRNLSIKSLKAVRKGGPYDLLIVEQAIRNLETYRTVLDFKLSKQLSFWGHGRTYTVGKSAIEERLKSFLTNRGRWFFGYTKLGVEAVVSQGFDRSRTTVVQNSIDSKMLRDQLAELKPDELKSFAEKHGLDGCTALYIGGIDDAKRLPFLLDAAQQVRSRNSSFRLLIAGSGSLNSLVEEHAERYEWIRYLGPVFGRDKALAIESSEVMAIPGRVGLVAVDSLASGTPIVTTDWPYHAPEFEYLESGRTAIVSPNSIEDYVNALTAILADRNGLIVMKQACLAESEIYTAESMAEKFTIGIRKALGMEAI